MNQHQPKPTAQLRLPLLCSIVLGTLLTAPPSEIHAQPSVVETTPRNGGLATEAQVLRAVEAERIEANLRAAEDIVRIARQQARRQQFDSARATYQRALNLLEPNPRTQPMLQSIHREIADLEVADSRAARPSASLPRGAAVPANTLPVEEVSPGFLERERVVRELFLRGRSQFVHGDLDGAERTFREIQRLAPDHIEAKQFLERIAASRAQVGAVNRQMTRTQMLEEVGRAWQRPNVFEESPRTDARAADATPMLDKLNSIIIPNVNFSGVELGRVVSTLSALSEEFDPAQGRMRGVNIVLLDPAQTNPPVSITLRNLSMRRILDFVVGSIGFQYEVQEDAVVIRPGGPDATDLITEFFPISRPTVNRMSGSSGNGATPATAMMDDPFGPPGDGFGTAPGSVSGDAEAIRNFLQQAGVNFDNVPGSRLAYDGSNIIVTQTNRNLERIRNILNRYTEVRQVEIEAKFVDVREGALDELGFRWGISRTRDGEQTRRFLGTSSAPGSGTVRSLGDTFNPSQGGGSINIVTSPEFVEMNEEGVPVILPGSTDSFPSGAPVIPGAPIYGPLGFANLGSIIGSIGNFDVDLIIRALEQRTGTDLLSAPKVTVLSGKRANITVAQELRYPNSYGQIQSNVGTGSRREGSDAGVTITAGTPQDFRTRNVGVELGVTPRVEEDDYTITLDLNPRVTEFEGFVEFGGPSIAISGGRTVSIPSGFFQPIFSVREINTEVTVWDGATLIMGGLTREEARTVSDKVPVLGDIPMLGRLFRSQGESTQKRNLLIFVTANLVSPGGSPKRQTFQGVPPSSLFQNPTFVTPGGPEARRQGNDRR